MVQTLARFHKAIARLLATLFYLQFILIPVSSRAEAGRIRPDYAFARFAPVSVKPLLPEGESLRFHRDEDFRIPASAAGESIAVPELNAAPEEKESAFGTGPTQPEMNSFQSVNANNLVDLFSGDFSYNIPLLDVGGYPVNLHYQSGITMDQEASWVGLGWNINPGVISRNMRGLPDDFNGGADIVSKTIAMKPNVTKGVTGGADVELVGFPLNFQASLGIFHNTYKGWGTELGLNASINAGVGGKGSLTTGLGITNNSQSGLDISPSIGFALGKEDAKTKGSVTIGSNFNSRLGIQELQVTGSVKQSLNSEKKTRYSAGTSLNAGISFSKPSFTPTISIPYTSSQTTISVKVGGEAWGVHPSGFLRGYISKQEIKPADSYQEIPAYGYLNYQEAGSNSRVLLDFNREKDVAYTNNSPHIAVPIYTYDTWSISGEGTGGMFRAYRGDIGTVYDHSMTTKSESYKFGVDVGFGAIAHGGVDFGDAYSVTTNQPWISGNSMYDVTRFRFKDSTFENVYFKNPGEKAAVNKEYLKAIGDDNLMRVELTPYGNGQNDPDASATRSMALFKNGRKFDTTIISMDDIRVKREKRTQMISYLTAKEAKTAGLDKVIKSYGINSFPNGSCEGFLSINRDADGRQAHHISEVTVLNEEGRRYVYGVPVYNKSQVEVTMATDLGDNNTGLVTYGQNENSINNPNGKDGYFNKEVLPPFAHSYLLSGILSPDYVDLTGDGITEDDQGDAVKFNYSQLYSFSTPYKWRAPLGNKTAFYNEGLKTDNRDERGSYTYGEREVWMLNSIESKTMIATFLLENTRQDGLGAANEDGGASASQKLMQLKEINLYAKADWLKDKSKARPIKTVHFAYSYKLCAGAPGNLTEGAGKLTLDSVWFSYNKRQRAVKNAYVFKYHESNPAYDNKMVDRWGSHKPSKENPGTTGGPLSNADYSYTLQKGNGTWNKDSAARNVASWALAGIKLPSGGAIKVSYESDDYAYVQNKRAMQFFKLAGFGNTPALNAIKASLYPSGGNSKDYEYAFVKVSEAVSSVAEIRQKYLDGVEKLFFKLMVKIPADPAGFGSGSEIVPCYAEFDEIYKFDADPTMICFKLRPITSNESPVATAAIQYIRQNHPAKVYPYSEPGDNLDIRTLIGTLASVADNVSNTVKGFSKYARSRNFCNEITTDKSFVRLNNPEYRKLGGGHRVKKVEVFDNWNQMSVGDKLATYGQEYNYTTTIEVDGQQKEISSGVASYEPSIGGDENPFHVPFKLYSEKVGALAPTDFMYTEEPFAETFFPAASVGYSKVTVQSIHKTRKSSSGVTETQFYTTKDFPTLVEITPIDQESKKTYNPKLTNFLKVDAKNYVTLSQGFKVELNDMNGKVRSTISYAQTDLKNPVSYTYNYYRLEQDNASRKKLSNKVSVIRDTTGTVNEDAEVGKEVEIMIDVREQTSISGNFSVEANVDFVHPLPPIFLGSAIPIPSKETNRFRSIAVLKVVNRYGILDSVVVIEKGSKVSTRNLVFDAETGTPLITRTNNMFDDPVYSLNYPAHWAYSGMDAAYKNHGTVLTNLELRRGILFRNGSEVDLSRFFESGDEILVTGKHTRSASASNDPCNPSYYVYDVNTASTDSIFWAIHGDKGMEKEKGIYFIDRRGYPVTAKVDVMKIIRSGKRNNGNTSIGSITSMADPVRRGKIVIDDTTKVLNAQAARFKDKWKIEKVLRQYDSCLIETRTGSTYVPFVNSLIRKYYTSSANTHNTSYNDPLMVAGYHQMSADFFIARSLLRLNMSNIPSNAVITSAQLDLSGRAPIGLYGHAPYNDGNLNYSYEGTEEQTVGFIVPFTQYVTAGSNPNWESDISLNASPYKDTLIFRGYSNMCVDYKGVNVKEAVQQLVGLHPDQQNLLLKLNTEANINGSREIRFMSFYGGNGGGSSFATESFNTFAACNQGGTPANCQNTTCAPELYVQYQYGEHTCYKVCRQEYLQGDTLNPYVVGILGNWRVDTSYVYYSDRKESSVATKTNIRTDGLIKDFKPYWTFGGKYLTANPDITRWSWNSKSTLYNRKGFELENTDPLDRYNAAIYGFNKTVPVATAQNSRNTEFTFDGFEDQEYQTDNCLKCFESGWMKLNADNGTRTETTSHSGRNSLKVYANKKMDMNIPLVATPPSDMPELSVKRDSVMLVKTSYYPNGTGLNTQYGVYLANAIINNCLGQNINSIQWWLPSGPSNVNVDWGSGGPSAFCATNYFKALWTGKLLVQNSDIYGFRAGADDEVTVKINGNTVLYQPDNGNPQTGSLFLAAGWHDISVEFTEEAGNAYCNIRWFRGGNTTEENLPLNVQYTGVDGDAIKKDTTWCIGLRPIKKTNAIADKFTAIKGSRVVVSAWVREEALCTNGAGYQNANIKVSFTGASNVYTLRPAGKVIEGWQRVEETIFIPNEATSMKYELVSGTSAAAYFDDLRIHPFNANMKSFVYDPISLRLMAEQDENNYSTFYEYDDEGTLTRVKKETERGVKTIKETRSALTQKNIQDQP